MDSFKLLSARAMSLQHPDSDSVRSIGGRLGGRIDSFRSASSLRKLCASGLSTLSFDSSVTFPANEETHLMPPSPLITSASIDEIRGGDVECDGHPPLGKWILPALSCGASYAFYYVSS